MKNNKIEFINDYIDKFNSIILNVKPQREKIEKIYKTLIKYQKKMQYISLGTEEAPPLHLISVWI